MAKEKKFINGAAALAAYRNMIEGVPGVERKGATSPYTSLNGNMYSAMNGADVIGIRLSKEDREAFMAKYKSSLYEGYPGFFQKEYAAVPKKLYSDTRALRHWFRKSHAYVSSLKPKKTTR